jgi:hypothetical protein
VIQWSSITVAQASSASRGCCHRHGFYSSRLVLGYWDVMRVHVDKSADH